MFVLDFGFDGLVLLNAGGGLFVLIWVDRVVGFSWWCYFGFISLVIRF